LLFEQVSYFPWVQLRRLLFHVSCVCINRNVMWEHEHHFETCSIRTIYCPWLQSSFKLKRWTLETIEMDDESCDDIVEPMHAFWKLHEFGVMHFKHSSIFRTIKHFFGKIWCLGIKNVLHIDHALDFQLLIANRWFN
jgi:hypothetical protein